MRRQKCNYQILQLVKKMIIIVNTQRVFFQTELLKKVNSQIQKYITLNAFIREEERLETEQMFILSQKKQNKIKKIRGKKE